MAKKPVTVERTTKRAKLIQLAGVGVALSGAAFSVVFRGLYWSPIVAIALLIIGILVCIVGGLLAWWETG